MVKQEDVDKMQLRQNYHNLWHTNLLHTLQADTPYFCFSLFCSPCASYLLRKRALYNDMSRYVCCAGFAPCSGRCGEHRCPEFCLVTEVLCCFGDSVASTRFLLQDEFNIHTTQCDNCIILEARILVRPHSSFLALPIMVCACMQTQHKTEMDKRDGKIGAQQAMAAPPLVSTNHYLSLC
ncbi:hypothetical protein V2J09_020234 [Rumex salicifolius]